MNANIGINPNEKSYSTNPLVSPLIRFHGRILSTVDALPPEGKLVELMKRVGAVAIAPFAYLILTLIAIPGVVLNSLINGPLIETRNQQKRTEKVANTKTAFDELKTTILSDIPTIKPFNEIQAAKIYLSIRLSDSHNHLYMGPIGLIKGPVFLDCLVQPYGLNEHIFSAKYDKLFNVIINHFCKTADSAHYYDKIQFEAVVLLQDRNDRCVHVVHRIMTKSIDNEKSLTEKKNKYAVHSNLTKVDSILKEAGRMEEIRPNVADYFVEDDR